MPPFGPPPNEDETREFARNLEQAVRNRDANAIEAALRTRDLVMRSISDFGLSEKEMESAMRGVDKSLQQNSLAAEILHQMEDGSSFKLLRVHNVDGRNRALCRLWGSNGVNYFDFVVARHPDGVIAMEDVYIFLSAEMMSQTMRRIVIPLFSQLRELKDKNKLSDADRAYLDNIGVIREFAQAAKAGNAALATAKYRQLPANLQENKSVLLLYIQAFVASDETNEEYVRQLERFRRLFPNDGCVDFLSIDYYALKKDYAAAIKACERVEQSVGGDAHMKAMRANCHVEANNFAEAAKLITEALKDEPDLDTAHWSRITLSLREKKHAETLDWLKKIVTNCKVEIDDLTLVAEYADFVKSPQHREWVKWYAAKKN
jgi:tetratricopeptide (TPR) repeat protein